MPHIRIADTGMADILVENPKIGRRNENARMRTFPGPKKIALLTLILLLVILFYALDLGKHMTFDALQSTRESVTRLYAAHRFATVAVFIAVYMLLSALALPGPLVLTLVAGAVFGIFMGTFFTTLAASIGASLAFLAVRYLFADLVRKKLGTRLDRINTELEKEGLRHLVFLRLVMIFPFTLVNIAAALTTMPHRTFFLGTFMGIFLPNLILCNAGAGIISITGITDVFSIRVIGSVFLLGLLALAPVIFRKARQRSRSHK